MYYYSHICMIHCCGNRHKKQILPIPFNLLNIYVRLYSPLLFVINNKSRIVSAMESNINVGKMLK